MSGMYIAIVEDAVCYDVLAPPVSETDVRTQQEQGRRRKYTIMLLPSSLSRSAQSFLEYGTARERGGY